MNIKNTNQSYGLLSITIHWVMALFIFFMFGLGLYMVELTYYDSWYKGSLDLHKSLGLMLFFLLNVRLIWRFSNIRPITLSATRWVAIAGHTAHFLLYGVTIVLMLSGYFISTADGRDIEVFNLFRLPALPFSIENQEDIAGDIHEVLAWGLMTLVAIHISAALKHHFLDKDRTLIRMLKP